jgi:small subunit ribosomal protein S14
MAKKSMIARVYKRKNLFEKYYKKRIELKKSKYFIDLQKLPRNSSPVRLHNRCNITYRPRGYMRQFGISRILFRELAGFGYIPGVKKSSW